MPSASKHLKGLTKRILSVDNLRSSPPITTWRRWVPSYHSWTLGLTAKVLILFVLYYEMELAASCSITLLLSCLLSLLSFSFTWNLQSLSLSHHLHFWAFTQVPCVSLSTTNCWGSMSSFSKHRKKCSDIVGVQQLSSLGICAFGYISHTALIFAVPWSSRKDRWAAIWV